MPNETARSKLVVVIALFIAAIGCAAGVYFWPSPSPSKPTSEVKSVEEINHPVSPGKEKNSSKNGVTAIFERPFHEDKDLDNWPTEKLAGEVDEMLGRLRELVVRGQPIREVEVAGLVADSLGAARFVPSDLKVVFQDDTLTVWRKGDDVDSSNVSKTGDVGTRFAAAIEEIWAPYSRVENASCSLKTFDISTNAEGLKTRHFFSYSATTEQGLVEQHATFSIHWTTGELRITSLDVSDFERVLAPGSARPLLQDCTDSVLGRNECYRTQLLQGYNHWLRRMESPPYLYNLSSPAVAVADVNGDGLDDLYLSQEQGLPNRLFVQQIDGTAKEVSGDWGVDWLEDSRGALLVDLDNDGDQDLVVAVIGGVVLAENQEQRQFVVREVLPTSDDLMSLAAADYDRDGRLDLYACAYNPTLSGIYDGPGGLATAGARFVYHDANDGGGNHLFRNVSTLKDNWQFDDVTEAVGLDANNQRYSFAACWEDYDNDRDLDLYVANDFGRDNLYRNDGGKFTDVAKEVGAEDSGSGMAVSWGDYDRDGWMDAYVSNMFSSAGRRIASQPTFMPEAPEHVRERLRRFARGNTLLRNNGQGSFVDRASSEGVEIGRWAWSANFCDLNNDGWEDLLVANGFITTDDTRDL